MFVVEPYGDGFTIYRDGWGIGYTFKRRDLAEAACRALNDNVALDREDD